MRYKMIKKIIVLLIASLFFFACNQGEEKSSQAANSFEDNTGYAIVFSLWCNENIIRSNNFINNGNDVIFFMSALIL